MRALKRVRWFPITSVRKKPNLQRGGTPHLVRVDDIIRPISRSYSTTHFKLTETKPARLKSVSTLSDVLSHSKLSKSIPYLEAYNLMEENADVIFDQENMMNERAYNVEETLTLDSTSSPRPASELPGPKSWPVVGCLPYMLQHKDFDPQRVYLFWQAIRKEFGPIFRKDMPGHPNMVFITDPSDLQVMYFTTMYNPMRPGMQSLKKIRGRGGADGKTNTYYSIFGGKAGILAEQEDEWWRVRREVQKPITNSEIVGRYLPKTNEVAEAFIERIRSIRDNNNEVPSTFKKDLYEWALESLGTITLERRLGCLNHEMNGDAHPRRLVMLVEQLLEAFHETENIKLWQYFPTSSIKKLQEAHDVFTGVALEAIRDTQMLIKNRAASVKNIEGEVAGNNLSPPSSPSSASCPYDKQHLGLRSKEEEEEEGEEREKEEEGSGNSSIPGKEGITLLEILLELPGLSEGDVLTFLLDMLATGIDTTSHTAGNMLYLLARNPREQERMREEIERNITDPRNMTPQQIASLTYTKAVFRETLRVMPVNVGITRRLVRDTVLSGYLIPKGWQIVMPTMLMNFQEHIFPRATDFLPERFLRGSPYAPKHHFGFLPFSFGPRMCIGRRIAYQEIVCLVIRILTEFEVDYKHEDIHLINRLAYGPSQPLQFTFVDRKK